VALGWACLFAAPFVWRCLSGAVMFSTPMPTKHVVRVMSACRPIRASTDAVSDGSNTSTPAVRGPKTL
jgi:hypothetical protein